MDNNPYSAPETLEAATFREPVRLEVSRWRISVYIFAVPAIYNFLWFNGRLVPIQVAVNLAMFALLMISIWRFGVELLELVANNIRSFFAPNVDQKVWVNELHIALRASPFFAFWGAIIWMVWNIGFYNLGINFFLISWPVGIASHILAAGLYLPMFYRWYQLRAASQLNS